MKVYVFGNPDNQTDNNAIEAAKKLKGKVQGVEFIEVGLNKDLPFSNNENVVLMDVAEGIDKIETFYSKDLNMFPISPKFTVHDFDLVFQLKYLQKIGKLGEVTIIGLPTKGEPDYLLIQSILRKLVEQDMQGS